MGRKWGQFTAGVLPGQHRMTSLGEGGQRATVKKVDGKGCVFELLATPGHGYGPAPWSLGSYDGVDEAIAAGWCPRVGDRCVVLFCGSGVSNPVVLGWWR